MISSVEFDGPSRRAINIRLDDIDPKWIGTMSVNSQSATWSKSDKHFQVEPLLPGQYLISVVLGECEPKALGCHERADCPPGCLSSEQTIDVPWGEGTLDVAIRLPEPKPLVTTTTPKQKRPIRPASPRRGGLVTHAQFSKWLDANPDWLPSAAIAKNRAETGYLSALK